LSALYEIIWLDRNDHTFNTIIEEDNIRKKRDLDPENETERKCKKAKMSKTLLWESTQLDRNEELQHRNKRSKTHHTTEDTAPEESIPTVTNRIDNTYPSINGKQKLRTLNSSFINITGTTD
jgi:hypothetical protein